MRILILCSMLFVSACANTHPRDIADKAATIGGAAIILYLGN